MTVSASGWAPPSSMGRVGLAFGPENPQDVDALFETVTAAGYDGPLEVRLAVIRWAMAGDFGLAFLSTPQGVHS